MKKLIVIALAFVLIFPNNGCRILKHKLLDKKSEQANIQNDVQVKTKLVDSLAVNQKYFSDKSNTTIKETISYKSVDEEPIELTASFRIDTAKSLKGDTALTLVGKGVSLTITRNPLNNTLTANIKSGGKTKKVAFNELLINRTITNNKEIVDSSKSTVLTKKMDKDSIDKSKIEIKKSESHLDKTKDYKPDWKIWLGIGAIVGLGIYLLIRKRP